MAMVNLPLQFKVALALFIFVTYIILPGGAVKRETFKTCEQSGFCKRNRDLADKTSVLGKSWSCPYELQPDSLTFEDGILSGTLRKIDSSGEYIRFPITISFYTSGEARIVIDEERRMRGLIELRHGSKANKKRYDEAWKWATVGSLELSKSSTFDASQPRMGFSQVEYGPNNMFRAILHHSPFEVEIQKGDQTHIHLNSRGLLNLEHWRPKESGRSSSEDDTTWWEETFDRHTDSKPRGPESVAMDINFPGYGHVFGIPEHADVHSTLGLSVSRQCE
ncbi:glucosidase II [Paecilomyces lecythidis]